MVNFEILDRKVRELRHQKQERLQVGNGIPPTSSLQEGLPVIRYVSGKGLYEFVRYNNQLYYKKYTQGVP